MAQYRYEVRGHYFEKESGTDMKVDFVCLRRHVLILIQLSCT